MVDEARKPTSRIILLGAHGRKIKGTKPERQLMMLHTDETMPRDRDACGGGPSKINCSFELCAGEQMADRFHLEQSKMGLNARRTSTKPESHDWN